MGRKGGLRVASCSWHCASRLLCCLATMLSLGCIKNDKVHLVRGSGCVSYEDGTPIPEKPLVLNFHPVSAAEHNHMSRPAASAIVDSSTGRFKQVTTRRFGDGLVSGQHRVTVHLPGRKALPATVAAPEYSDEAKTPLKVDTAVQPFDIRLKRPTAK